jgi:hypothetical protein
VASDSLNLSRQRDGVIARMRTQALSATPCEGNDDLVAQLAAKYGLEKAQAQRDVDGLMKGRQI